MKSPNLIGFPGTEERAQLARDLAEMSEQVKSGEIIGVAWAAVHEDGGTSAGWGWQAGVDAARLIGGAAVLQHRLIHELDI